MQGPVKDRRRVLVLGATGTIGRATVSALIAAGNEVVCPIRPRVDGGTRQPLPAAANVRIADVGDPASLLRDGLRGERFDALVSCLASRTGVPEDAWAVDHHATVQGLELAVSAGITHAALLSAICVQRPTLEFQRAKLAAEGAFKTSGVTWSIIRPTAFFKSLSGQIERVRNGKPYLLFGDGRLTASKPVGDGDLGRFIATSLDDPDRQNRILPIGGPGNAITPREQGEHLFQLLGQPPRFRHLPIGLLDAVVAALSATARIAPGLRSKAELARIGRYYATESMLLLDGQTGRYDADSTPVTGTDTLRDFYARVLRGEDTVERGEHAVF